MKRERKREREGEREWKLEESDIYANQEYMI